MINKFALKAQEGYHIRHEMEDGRLSDTWHVYFDDEIVDGYRAKSRSKFEMQHLLDHVNQAIILAEGYGACVGRSEGN